MDVLNKHPVRKTKKQKEAFRQAVVDYCRSRGYETSIENGSMGARNLVIGDPSRAKYLVTAHYDTPASIGIPNVLTPCNPVTFLLYQLFVVGIFLAVAFAAGFLTMLLTKDRTATFLVAYAAYMGFFFLMLIGPANRHNANDNTSGVVTLLEIAATMPEKQRKNVAFVLFDLEEAGLLGSASYRKAHKAETDRQIILNLDCVGDGDEIVFFPTKKLCRDGGYLGNLCRVVGHYGKKTIAVCDRGFRTYPSDQKNFPLGVGIAAFHRKKGIGLYCDKIHTGKDRTLELTNVNLLRSALTTLITGHEKINNQ